MADVRFETYHRYDDLTRILNAHAVETAALVPTDDRAIVNRMVCRPRRRRS